MRARPPAIVRLRGQSGAVSARGLVVVIDVLRAFTTAAYAFDGGATKILLVRTVDEAIALRELVPDALLIGEVGGRLIPGFDLDNSPTHMAAADVAGPSAHPAHRGRHAVRRRMRGCRGARPRQPRRCGRDGPLHPGSCPDGGLAAGHGDGGRSARRGRRVREVPRGAPDGRSADPNGPSPRCGRPQPSTGCWSSSWCRLPGDRRRSRRSWSIGSTSRWPSSGRRSGQASRPSQCSSRTACRAQSLVPERRKRRDTPCSEPVRGGRRGPARTAGLSRVPGRRPGDGPVHRVDVLGGRQRRRVPASTGRGSGICRPHTRAVLAAERTGHWGTLGSSILFEAILAVRLDERARRTRHAGGPAAAA